MRRRPLLGACGVAALCVAAAFALLAGGRVGATFASFNNFFNGETENVSNTSGMDWLTAPTLAAPTVTLNDAALSWTLSTHTVPGYGQKVLGSATASSGTTTTCPTSGYSLVTTPTATATSYTDTGRGSGIGGEYYCYEVASTAGTNWSTASTAQRVQFPFYATSVSVTNGGTSNSIGSGDKVTIAYNNTPSTLGSSGSVSVITCTTTRVLLGASSCSSTPSIGTLTLSGTRTVPSSSTFASSGYSVSSNTLTLTLGTGTAVAMGGSGSQSWKYTPPATIKQPGSVAICTTGSCLPSTSSGF